MSLFTTPEFIDQPARQRILLTAHRLFYQKGIRATGIDLLIAESGVAKATFYHHFSSKNKLIQAFLIYRHEKWMDWFTDALRRHATEYQGITALVPVLREWFEDKDFRGCAFINGVIELGATQPDVIDITRKHKDRMTAVISELLPISKHRLLDAQAVSLALDGAIIHAQYAQNADSVLLNLARLLDGFQVTGYQAKPWMTNV
jgi:AcrR family transcriptional regulator